MDSIDRAPHGVATELPQAVSVLIVLHLEGQPRANKRPPSCLVREQTARVPAVGARVRGGAQRGRLLGVPSGFNPLPR